MNRAGAAVRDGTATTDDTDVIDAWRAAHRSVLNTFQAILRFRTRGSDVTVAQRHKRKRTIYGKLQRFPKMELARMDDVAGCRLIFQSIDELRAFRMKFHQARFNHRLRNDPDKYDYIATPKSTGYRGVHDVYSYDVNSEQGRDLKGLLVEIQYRTLVQHAWATAVEVIGFITESQPKFEEGDDRYIEAMALASEIIARVWERCPGPYPEMEDAELVQAFLSLDEELGLLAMLKGLNSADAEVTSNRNIILIIAPDGELEVRTFRDATQALRELFELERDRVGHDIVLVKADSGEDVRLAFRNYFSDARDFIHLVEEGCQRLAGRRVVRKKRRAKKKTRRK